MPHLHIEPASALIDVERTIRITGLQPSETVEIVAETVRANNIVWQSKASFQADAQGVIEVSKQAPMTGSYSGVSAMGLIWSQEPKQPIGWQGFFTTPRLAPILTHLSISQYPDTQAVLTQIQLDSGIERTEVYESDCIGTLFKPVGSEALPVVIVLNGSGGGIPEERAALIATKGYQALALGYFKAPHLPDYISNIPLEYFEKALHWAHAHLRPAKGFVAISGQSRGGELVLLLGSLFPQLISAVIGYVPGACVHSAQNACDPSIGREGPAWLYQGKSIPHLWENNPSASWKPWDEGPEPRRHTDALLTALQDPIAVERSAIKVENIQAPILLFSGSDDGSWPSSLYCQMIAQRLERFGNHHPLEHQDYTDAGHSILFPYVPTTQITHRHPVSQRLSTSGGTAPVNAYANEHSWKVFQAFVQKAFDNTYPRTLTY